MKEGNGNRLPTSMPENVELRGRPIEPHNEANPIDHASPLATTSKKESERNKTTLNVPSSTNAPSPDPFAFPESSQESEPVERNKTTLSVPSSTKVLSPDPFAFPESSQESELNQNISSRDTGLANAVSEELGHQNVKSKASLFNQLFPTDEEQPSLSPDLNVPLAFNDFNETPSNQSINNVSNPSSIRESNDAGLLPNLEPAAVSTPTSNVPNNPQSIDETMNEMESLRLAQSLEREEEANMARRMRKRTYAQLYPYSTEMAHYKIQVRSSGIRPTKLVDRNDDRESDPSVTFEERQRHAHDLHRHQHSERHHKKSQSERQAETRPREIRRKSDISTRTDKGDLNRDSEVGGQHLTQLARRIIPDSEDETETESSKQISRQHVYFSDSDENNQNELKEGTSGKQNSGIDNWDPFVSEDDDPSEAEPPKKGALPATFIQELLDESDEPIEHDVSVIESLPVPPRKGVAIRKRGTVKHTVRRELHNHDENAMPIAPATQPSNSSHIPDFEITHVNPTRARKSMTMQEPYNRYSTQQKQKQTDIRDFGDDIDGAQEYDEIDHMISRANRGSRVPGNTTGARRRTGSSKKHAVAVSRNPARTTPRQHRGRASQQNISRPAQSAPVKRYHGSIVQNFVDSFQGRRPTIPGLSGVNTERHAYDTIPDNGQGETNKKVYTARHGPRPMAVVSGLHTPRNKPKTYTSVFQVESGSYVPRVPPKARRKNVQQSIAEFPVEAFDVLPNTPTENSVQPSLNTHSEQTTLAPERASNAPNLGKAEGSSNYITTPRHPLDDMIMVEQDVPTAGLPVRHPLDLEMSEIEPLKTPSNSLTESNLEKLQSTISRSLDPLPNPVQGPISALRKLKQSLKKEAYSFNFNCFPLNTSVCFEESSFVGQGTFEKILRGSPLTDVPNSWSGYFGTDIGLLNWGPLDLDVVKSFENSSEVIVKWITGSQDQITNEHVESSYFYWKFVNQYFFQKMGFAHDNINYADTFTAKIVDVINDRIMTIVTAWKATTERRVNWSELTVTSATFLLTLLLPIFRRNRAASASVPRIFTEVSELLLKHLFSKFNEISAKINLYRSLTTNPPLTRSSYFEVSYMCVHILDTASDVMGIPSFFQSLESCIKGSVTSGSEIDQNEVIWHAVFLFNNFYHLRDPDFGSPLGGWQVVNSLAVPFFETLRQGADSVTQSMANYAKALLARCLILITTWNWSPDREVIKAAYSCFASIRYANLEPRDVGHQLPKFLMKSDLHRSITTPSLEDTIFGVFLKLLAVSMKAYKKISPKQLRRLVDSVNVLNNFTYPPRDAEIQIVELESLANQYSLLLTRYKYASKTAQPPLEQLVGLFSLENSHLKARELTVDAWKVVTEIQIYRNQDLTSAMYWYDKLLGKAFDEYLRLEKASGPTASHLRSREIRRRKDHLEAYEAFLFRPLNYINKMLSNRIALVKSVHWETLLRKSFQRLLSSSATEGLQLAVLDVFQSYISSATYMLTAEPPATGETADEDSQTLDFAIPVGFSKRQELVSRLASHYSTTIPIHFYKEFLNNILFESNTSSDTFVRKAINLWAETAQFLVSMKEADWQTFYYSWQWFRKSARRTTYEPYWLAAFLKVCGAYYLEEEPKFLEYLVRYLVCVHPVYEHQYVTALLAKKPVIFRNCELDLISVSSGNFTQGRLALLQTIIKELGAVLVQQPAFSNVASSLLAAITDTLKTNCKELEFKNENGYMTLVHQVIDWIFQYCPGADIEWFLNPETFPVAARDEEHVTFKTAKFKKMLQIDFGNEYAAGFRLMHFFCLELQASALAGDSRFKQVITEALVPETYGGVYSDVNARAREFLLKAFVKPYLVEACKNKAARVFLNPIVDTVTGIFKIQYEIGVLTEATGPAVDLLGVLQTYVWLSVRKAVNRQTAPLYTDFWVWKCTTGCFAIAQFLAQGYIEQPSLAMPGSVASCFTSLLDLAFSILTYLVCELPRTMPERPLSLYPSLSGRAALDQPPDTSQLTFHKPILNSFISQVKYDGALKHWAGKGGPGAGQVIAESSFDLPAQRAAAHEAIWAFLQSVSYLPPTSATGKLVLGYLWTNYSSLIDVLGRDARSRFRVVSFLNPAARTPTHDASGIPNLFSDATEDSSILHSPHLSTLNDDIIF